MAGHYHIEIIPDQSLVRLTLSGFYEPSEINLLATAFTNSVSELGCAPNQHVTICDIREMAIQSQQAVGSFTQMMASEGVRSRKLAFVTARSLARMQARRLTDRPNVAFFDDFTSAEAWLEIMLLKDGSKEVARGHRSA